MKNLFISLGSLLVLSSLVFMPVYASAQTTGKSLGLFPCSGVVDPNVPGSKECTFNDVIKLVDSIVKALFIGIMIVAPLLIARAGYYFLISGNRPTEREKAKNQLLNIVIGLVIVACSYAVVKLVLNVLLSQTTISNVPF